MKKTTITIGALLLAAPMVLTADTHPAAWQLFMSSYSDTVLNPPTGEDSDFFVTTGGVPNLMFLLDTSGSMLRMPPDGAGGSWGPFYENLSGTAFPGSIRRPDEVRLRQRLRQRAHLPLTMWKSPQGRSDILCVY